MNPFDYANAINSRKDIIRNSENPELAEKLYQSFFVNKALSYHIDTVLYSNEMNMKNHLDSIMQNDYYLNSIRPKKRFSKWHKKINDEAIEVIQEYYKVGYSKAVEISKVLTEEQISLIKIRTIKGGNNVQSRSTSGS